MKLTRRSFFKLGGAAAITAAAAPLFIPAQRLDFGVPKQIIVPTADDIVLLSESAPITLTYGEGDTVPMMLIHDNFIPGFGGRLHAGSVLVVDQATADRWAQCGVAMRTSKSLTEDIIPGRDFNVRYKTMWPAGYAADHEHAIMGGLVQPASRRVRDFGIQGG